MKFTPWLISTVHALQYTSTVYDTLVKHAYISKASYCASSIQAADENMSNPVKLKPSLSFMQKGYSEDEYYTNTENIDFYMAKYLYSQEQIRRCDEAHTDPVVADADGFFAVDHSGAGSIILAFRGTSNRRDYLTDIDVATVNYEPLDQAAKDRFGICDNCKVHKGFYRRYRELCDEIFATLTTLMGVFPRYRLVVTGHSMGGSLAILTGLELAILGYNPLVIAFGSPKVANGELARYMDTMFRTQELSTLNVMERDSLLEGCFRVIHKGDYMPLLPPGNKFELTGLEFIIEKEDLPHPMSSVSYYGPAEEISHHDTNFKLIDLVSLNWRKLLHVKEHQEYFFEISSCADLHFSRG